MEKVTEEFCISIRHQLEQLREENLTELKFTDFDSEQRKYTHNLARQLGLHSKSAGSKAARVLTISVHKKRADGSSVSTSNEPIDYVLKPSIFQQMQNYFNANPLTQEEYRDLNL